MTVRVQTRVTTEVQQEGRDRAQGCGHPVPRQDPMAPIVYTRTAGLPHVAIITPRTAGTSSIHLPIAGGGGLVLVLSQRLRGSSGAAGAKGEWATRATCGGGKDWAAAAFPGHVPALFPTGVAGDGSEQGVADYSLTGGWVTREISVLILTTRDKGRGASSSGGRDGTVHWGGTEGEQLRSSENKVDEALSLSVGSTNSAPHTDPVSGKQGATRRKAPDPGHSGWLRAALEGTRLALERGAATESERSPGGDRPVLHGTPVMPPGMASHYS